MIAAVLALALAGGEPLLVDAVAAVVERRVITRSEVDVEARLTLVERGAATPLGVPLDDAFRAAMLEALLVEELLALEARRTAGIVVREVDVDAALQRLRARLDDEGGYETFLLRSALDEEALRAILRRQLMVRALLGRWLQTTPPADADALAAWVRAHPGATDDDGRAALRHAAEERVVGTHIEALKRASDWRVVAPWARGAAAP